MSDSIFISCNRKVRKNIEKAVKRYDLCECHTSMPNEKIYKNNDILLLRRKKYVFLKAFSDEDNNRITQVRDCLLE